MVDLEKLKSHLAKAMDLRGEPLYVILNKAYVQEGLSLSEIARLTKGEASREYIKKLLLSYQIKLRPRGGKHERRLSATDAT